MRDAGGCSGCSFVERRLHFPHRPRRNGPCPAHLPLSRLGPACSYVWGACSVRPTSAHNSVGKWDTKAGTVQVRLTVGTNRANSPLNASWLDQTPLPALALVLAAC